MYDSCRYRIWSISVSANTQDCNIGIVSEVKKLYRDTVNTVVGDLKQSQYTMVYIFNIHYCRSELSNWIWRLEWITKREHRLLWVFVAVCLCAGVKLWTSETSVSASLCGKNQTQATSKHDCHQTDFSYIKRRHFPQLAVKFCKSEVPTAHERTTALRCQRRTLSSLQPTSSTES